MEEIKIIKNIDCVDDINCMFNQKKEYVLINCYNGIRVISSKTKELVQYIEKFTSLRQKICSNYDSDIIFILNENRVGIINI